MKTLQLTVFTEPVSPEGLLHRFKSLVRPLGSLVGRRKHTSRKKYGGHYAVTRSLVEGLKTTHADFNYNPRYKNIFENVIVLAGVERLKKAIDLKKNGTIRFLLTGPNVVDDVLSEKQLVADPAIDYYIVPSEWVRRLVLRDCLELKDRVLCWPAGVDSEYWKPGTPKDERNDVLIYWKSEPESFCNEVIEIVKENDMHPVVVKNGSYGLEEFREHLDKSRFAIFISRSESQGIALAEAWSMDVPTFAFDPGEFSFHGRMIYDVSSCPYLTSATGLKWKNAGELRRIFQNKNYSEEFSPREYVLKYLTDEQTAKHLVKTVESLQRSSLPGIQ